MANYNNGRFFKTCYDSIIAQSYQEWEVIIVNDGSTDDSAEVIQLLIAGDSRFKYFENEGNHGCGYTKRRCLELASGELCGFLDPDDVIEPIAVERMVETHAGNDHVLVYSNCMLCDGALKPYNVYHRAKQVDASDPSFFNLDYPVLAFCSFKRASYLQTEGIDAYMKRAVDQDLYLKLAETGTFLFINDVLYHYRMHKDGISVSNHERSQSWHWIAIIAAARRRNIAVDTLFVNNFVPRKDFEQLKSAIVKSRLLKLKRYLFRK